MEERVELLATWLPRDVAGLVMTIAYGPSRKIEGRPWSDELLGATYAGDIDRVQYALLYVPPPAKPRGAVFAVAAAISGSAEIVQALLEAGMVPTRRALVTAARAGHDEVVGVLLRAGARADNTHVGKVLTCYCTYAVIAVALPYMTRRAARRAWNRWGWVLQSVVDAPAAVDGRG